MPTLSRWILAGLISATVPATSFAQPPVTSFEDLRTVLEPGALIVIVPSNGEPVWGRLTTIASDDVEIQLVSVTPQGSGFVTSSERRSFRAAEVARLVLSDSSGKHGRVLYPASWHMVEALRPMDEVDVKLRNGGRARYRFRSIDPESLVLTLPSGAPLSIPRGDVKEIVERGHRDPLGNGIAIGALTGVGVALGGIAIGLAQCRAGCDAPAYGEMAFAAGAFGGAIGAGAGLLIDLLRKGNRVIYPAPPPRAPALSYAPIVAPDVKGLQVSVRF